MLPIIPIDPSIDYDGHFRAVVEASIGGARACAEDTHEAVSTARALIAQRAEAGWVAVPDVPGSHWSWSSDSERRVARTRAAACRVLLDAYDGGGVADALPGRLAEAVRQVEAWWRASRDVHAQYAAQADALRERFGHACGLSVQAVREVDSHAYAALRAAFIAHHTVGRVPLAIDDAVLTEVLLDGKGIRAFTPARAMAMLQACFAANAHAAQCARAAEAFASAFGVQAGAEVETVKGCAVLSVRTWICDIDRKFSRISRYAMGARMNVEAAVNALADLWPHLFPDVAAGDIDAAREAVIGAFQRADWRPSTALRPAFLGIGLRCFQGSVAFHIPTAIADEIVCFVSAHAPRLQQAA